MGDWLEVIRPGAPVPYMQAFDAQISRRTAVEDGQAREALFLLEHAPVITLGRNTQPGHVLRSRDELKAMGVAVEEVNRGGDVTYHGLGQMVAYPIVRLRERGLSIKGYLRRLESVLIEQLALYGLPGERNEGFTGVWINGAKIAAIGVGVHRGVTFHGVSLNVEPNMAHFGLIIPCGIADKPVASLRGLLGAAPPMARVMDDFERCFRNAFACDAG